MKRLVVVLTVWAIALAGALSSLLLPASSASAVALRPASITTGTRGDLTPLPTVSTGESHSCVVTSVGAVRCWGENFNGQLGNGTTTSSRVRVDVVGLGAGVTAVSAGREQTCALTSAGAVKCWGNNLLGGLGNGTTTDSAVPVDVVGLGSGVVAVSAGDYHACAVTSAGAVKCWGMGDLGNGLYTSSAVPVDVIGLESGAVAVAAGDGHSCAVTSSGAVKCWGYNQYGQLGDGTTTSALVPVDVSGLGSGAVSVTAGINHTCALTSAGAVMCWGQNINGAVGGTTSNSGADCTSGQYTCTVPVEVSGLGSGAVAVSASTYNSCALTTAGGVKCWGSNWSHQLGAGSDVTLSWIPVDVIGLGTASSVSVGGYHSCAVTVAGAVKCWGDNSVGQLGDGTTTGSGVPVGVIGLGSVPTTPTSVAAAAGNAEVVVNWTAPSSDSGSPITSYTVTAAPGGRTATTTGATTATVTGLTNGTAYTFTVTATNIVGSGAASLPSLSVTPVSGLFTALPPARVFDGTATTVPRLVTIAGLVGVPADATAVVVNVEVQAPTAAGYVRVTPAGSNPGVATQEFVRGQTISNLVVVNLVGGKIQVKLSAGSARVFMDVSGYYSTRAGSSFTVLPPDRIFVGTASTVPRLVQIAGQAGVPADATSVVVNVEVLAPTAAGYVRVTPAGSNPSVAVQEFAKGQTISNLVVVKLVGGKIQVKVSAGSAGILMDVSGYYTAGAGTSFTALPMTRVFDGTLTAAARLVQIAGLAGVPADATAVVVNTEVSSPSEAGYMRVIPPGMDRSVAVQEFAKDQTISNLVVVQLGDGKLQMRVWGGSARIMMDIAGYYSPGTP